MFKFVFKSMLTALIAVGIISVLDLPPGRRAEQLRKIGIETLRHIEGLAEWGRESLDEGVPQRPDEAAGEDPPAAGLPPTRGARVVIPDDVRVRLQAELESLTKTLEAQEFSDPPSFRSTGPVIPDDFRRLLQAEVVAFQVPTLSDWWAKLRLETVDSNLDPERRRDVVKAVVSLAHLLPRDIWVVDGLQVPTRNLAKALAEYNRAAGS